MSVNAMKGTQWCLYVLVMRIEWMDLLNGGKFQHGLTVKLGKCWVLNGY